MAMAKFPGKRGDAVGLGRPLAVRDGCCSAVRTRRNRPGLFTRLLEYRTLLRRMRPGPPRRSIVIANERFFPMADFVLAIDQGTTGTRAVVYDSAGQALGTAAQELTQHFPQPGWV